MVPFANDLRAGDTVRETNSAEVTFRSMLVVTEPRLAVIVFLPVPDVEIFPLESINIESPETLQLIEEEISLEEPSV